MDMFTEFTDAIAVRKILQGVKGRVEGRIESFARQNVEFAVYLTALVSLLASLVLFLRRALSMKTWLTTLAIGVVWLAVWYAPIGVGVSGLADLAALWGLRHMTFRHHPVWRTTPDFR